MGAVEGGIVARYQCDFKTFVSLGIFTLKVSFHTKSSIHSPH